MIAHARGIPNALDRTRGRRGRDVKTEKDEIALEDTLEYKAETVASMAKALEHPSTRKFLDAVLE